MSSTINFSLRRSCFAAICCVAVLGCAAPAAPPPKEAKIAALEKLGFTPASDGWEISLGVRLLFDSDVDSLSNDGRKAVSDLSRTLREVGIDRIRVDGHTDNVGSDKYNAGLSLRRAESVAQHLVKGGWRDDAIERHGYGAAKPVADNGTPAGRAQNRRVVIAVQVE